MIKTCAVRKKSFADKVSFTLVIFILVNWLGSFLFLVLFFIIMIQFCFVLLFITVKNIQNIFEIVAYISKITALIVAFVTPKCNEILDFFSWLCRPNSVLYLYSENNQVYFFQLHQTDIYNYIKHLNTVTDSVIDHFW